MATVVIIVLVIIAAGYLILAFNSLWIYRIFDRALGNRRDFLSPSFERPRYFTRAADGKPDGSARWPGWDGWYFFLFPGDRALGVRMIRASIMTGLYGLDGVDDDRALPPHLSTFSAIERLILAPCETTVSGETEKTNLFSHEYLPKSTALAMAADQFDVSVGAPGQESGSFSAPWARMRGAWPHYQFDVSDPQTKLAVSVAYHAEDIVWWADAPGLFTYFTTFGSYEGTVAHLEPSGAARPGASVGAEATRAIKGRGGFEHGFARKPFNFTLLWQPVRWINALFPSFHPVRYNYQLVIGDHGLHGGFMLVRGFGINFRNRGGFYLDGNYVPVLSVKVDYLEYGAGAGIAATVFPLKWRVTARTSAGALEYTATREWPAPPVSSNMTYHNFVFTGSYRGRAIGGQGYGEYLNI